MILVLGGEGFLGSAFVAELRRQRRSCVAVTRANYARYKGRSCDLLINANGNSAKYLAEKDPALDFDLAVRSTLASLLDFRFRKYLYISSVAIYSNPASPAATREDVERRPPFASPYGCHRSLAEALVRQHAPRWLILRLGGLIGPKMKKGPLFDLMNGERLRVHPSSRFQFIDTRQVARLSLQLANKPKWNSIFNLAGRGSVALSHIARKQGLSCRARPGAKRETWNVNVAKIARLVNVPTTLEAVSGLSL